MKDKIRRMPGVMVYFDIVKYHNELVGDMPSLNIHQLMNLVGDKESLLPDKYINHIRLFDFNFKKQCVFTDKEKESYNWVGLVDSIKKHGVQVPVIAEMLILDNGNVTYRAVEGKHRVAACASIEPFDKDMLIPSFVIKYNFEYTNYCYNNKIKPAVDVVRNYEKFI